MKFWRYIGRRQYPNHVEVCLSYLSSESGAIIISVIIQAPVVLAATSEISPAFSYVFKPALMQGLFAIALYVPVRHRSPGRIREDMYNIPKSSKYRSCF